MQIRTAVPCQDLLAWRRRTMESSGICRCWQGALEWDWCWLCLQLFLYRHAERQQQPGAKISPASLATHRPLIHTYTPTFIQTHTNTQANSAIISSLPLPQNTITKTYMLCIHPLADMVLDFVLITNNNIQFKTVVLG